MFVASATDTCRCYSYFSWYRSVTEYDYVFELVYDFEIAFALSTIFVVIREIIRLNIELVVLALGVRSECHFFLLSFLLLIFSGMYP